MLDAPSYTLVVFSSGCSQSASSNHLNTYQSIFFSFPIFISTPELLLPFNVVFQLLIAFFFFPVIAIFSFEFSFFSLPLTAVSFSFYRFPLSFFFAFPLQSSTFEVLLPSSPLFPATSFSIFFLRFN